MNFTESEALRGRALKVLPNACSTESKQPHRGYSPGPLFASHGDGAYFYDVDGNRWLDTVGGLGANLMGHTGPSYSLPHYLEVEVAEMLCERTGMETCRFAKNGKDATLMARRLALAHTGKSGTVYAVPGYHGCDDWYGVSQPRHGGMTEDKARTTTFSFNDLDNLEQRFVYEGRQYSYIGAVIIEQGVDEPNPGFYKGVRDLCDKYGALFILDEIVTGLRFPGWGVKSFYGIEPDLLCLGKAIGGGYPLSACLGKREVMERLNSDVFFSLTFGGEATSLQACKNILADLTFYNLEGEVMRDASGKPLMNDKIQHLWRLGQRWIDGVKDLIRVHGLQDVVQIKGHPPRTRLDFDEKQFPPGLLRSIWYQETLAHGVHFGIPVFISLAHTYDDVMLMLKAANAALGVIRIGVDRKDASGLLKGTQAVVIQVGRS